MNDEKIIEAIKAHGGGMDWLHLLANELGMSEAELRPRLEQLDASGRLYFYPALGNWVAHLPYVTEPV